MEYITNFSELKKYWGFIPRNVVRSVVLDTLAIRNRLFLDQNYLNTPRIQFLYIHHIFDDEVKNFESLLDELAKHHTFISHTEAVKKIWNDSIDKPYIAWSSDDGFKNNLKAAEILNDYGAKAIFFLNPASIGIKSPQKAQAFCAERLNTPPIEFLDWNDIDSLLRQGHEIGAHSMEHINMATMTRAQLEEDLQVCKATLATHCGGVKHFAYPYGNYTDFTKEAFDMVFKAGYVSCASAKRGCHYKKGKNVPPNELLIRRDQISAHWPLEHLNYVVSRGARKKVSQTNRLPEIWF